MTTFTHTVYQESADKKNDSDTKYKEEKENDGDFERFSILFDRFSEKQTQK